MQTVHNIALQNIALQIEDFNQLTVPDVVVPEFTIVEPLSEKTAKIYLICKQLFMALCQEVSSLNKKELRLIVEKICQKAAADPEIYKICDLFFKSAFESANITTYAPLCTPAAMPIIEKYYEFEELSMGVLHGMRRIDRAMMMLCNTFFHDLDVPLSNFQLSLFSLNKYIVKFLEISHFKRVSECLDIIYENGWSEPFVSSLQNIQHIGGPLPGNMTMISPRAPGLQALFPLGQVLTLFSKHMVQITAYKDTEEPPRKRQKTETPSLNTTTCYMHKVFLDSLPFFKRQFDGSWRSQQERPYITCEVGVEDPNLLYTIMQDLLTGRQQLPYLNQESQKDFDTCCKELQQYVATCDLITESSLPTWFWGKYTLKPELQELNNLTTLRSYNTRLELAKATNLPFFWAMHFSSLITGLNANKKMAASFLTKRYPTAHDYSGLLVELYQHRESVAPYLHNSFLQLQKIGAQNSNYLLNISCAIISLGSSLSNTQYLSFVYDFINDPISSSVSPEVIRTLFNKRTPEGYLVGLRLLMRMGSKRYKEALALGRELLTTQVTTFLNSMVKKKRNVQRMESHRQIGEIEKEMLNTVAAFGYTWLFDREYLKINLSKVVLHAATLDPDFCLQELQKSELSQDLFFHYILLHSIPNGKGREFLIQHCKGLAEKNQCQAKEVVVALHGLVRHKIFSTQTPIPDPDRVGTLVHPYGTRHLYCINQHFLNSYLQNPGFPEDFIEALSAFNTLSPDKRDILCRGLLKQFMQCYKQMVCRVTHLNSLLTLISQSPYQVVLTQEIYNYVMSAVIDSSSMVFYVQQEKEISKLQELLALLIKPSILSHVRPQDEKILTELFQQAFGQLHTLSQESSTYAFETCKASLIEYLQQMAFSPLQQPLLEIVKR